MSRVRAGLAALALLGLAGCAGPGPVEPVLTTAPAPPSTVAPAPVPAPTAIDVPAIDAHSTLVAVGLRADGTLDVPPATQPEQAAYYDGTPLPGAVGPALVVGHVNGSGRAGVFARLHRLRAGDEIVISRADADPAVFRVTRVEQVAKTSFPWDRVLGATTGPEIRLVTCGGDFDSATGHYVDNWVAYGVAAT